MSAAVLESRPSSPVSPDTVGFYPLSHLTSVEYRFVGIPEVDLNERAHTLLKLMPVPEPGNPPTLTLSQEELIQLRPGFKIKGGLPKPDFETTGGTIFDAKTTDGSQEYTYSRFTTENATQWQLTFNMNQLAFFPLARNFNFPNSNIDLSDVDLSPFLAELEWKQYPEKKSLQGFDIQHALVEYLIDENVQDFLELWTGETFEEDEEVFVFNEPAFEKHHCPDRVYVWPRIGIFPVDVYQRRKSSSMNSSAKTKQFRSHVDGVKNVFAELYGDEVDPKIIPILVKFNLDDDIKSLAIRPYIRRDPTKEELAMQAQEAEISQAA